VIRIQKYLSEQGICSRRQAERFIDLGYVLVNGTVVTEQGCKIDPDHDTVTLSNEAKQQISQFSYIMFNKPRGIVTHSAQEGERAIRDILPERYKTLAPIGRLDKDSCGLILLTNDGIFAKRCLQSNNPHKRLYDIKVSKPLSDDDIKTLEEGILILGSITKPCVVTRLNPYNYRIELIEGKNRQIRRMMLKISNSVVYLNRIQFGKLRLNDLMPGDVKEIRPQDVL
jgi:pseudouridine synthase